MPPDRPVVPHNIRKVYEGRMFAIQVESITLLPMGACRLRICSFPVVDDSAAARPWSATPSRGGS